MVFFEEKGNSLRVLLDEGQHRPENSRQSTHVSVRSKIGASCSQVQENFRRFLSEPCSETPRPISFFRRDPLSDIRIDNALVAVLLAG